MRSLSEVKQDALALGMRVKQQVVSRLEQMERVDNESLEFVANILDIPVEIIRDYNSRLLIRKLLHSFRESPALDNILVADLLGQVKLVLDQFREMQAFFYQSAIEKCDRKED